MQMEWERCGTRKCNAAMRRLRSISLGVAAGLAILSGLSSIDGDFRSGNAVMAAADRVAVASKVSGTVKRHSQGHDIALKVGDPVHSADHIVTGGNGRVRLQFTDGSTVVIGPDSDLQVASYDMSSGGQPGALLRLADGIVRAIVDTMPGNARFAVAAPTAVAAVRGTTFVMQADADTAGVFVIDGIVFVDTPDGSGKAVTVQNNRGTDVPKGGVPSAPGPWSTDRIKTIFALTKLD